MNILDALGRLVKLGYFVGLGGAMAFAEACGDGSTPERDADADAAAQVDDGSAPEDSRGEADAVEDAGAEDSAVEAEDAAADEADAGEDLWDVPLE